MMEDWLWLPESLPPRPSEHYVTVDFVPEVSDIWLAVMRPDGVGLCAVLNPGRAQTIINELTEAIAAWRAHRALISEIDNHFDGLDP